MGILEKSIIEKSIIRYVRGSLEAYLENKRTLSWIKGIIKKSGILEYKGLLREILDGLQHLHKTPRYREILKECLREDWMQLETGIVLDIISWEEWGELLRKAKGPNFQDKNGCIEFYMNIKEGENSLRYMGLAYPDRSLSSEKEAVILGQTDTHQAIDELYKEWREGKTTYQDYRRSEEEISKGHNPISDWMKKKYRDFKDSCVIFSKEEQ